MPNQDPQAHYDLLNYIKEGVLILDKDFNISYLNSSAKSLFNVYLEKKNNGNLKTLLPKDHILLAYLERMKEEKIAYLSEIVSNFKNHLKNKTTKMKIVQLHNSEGRPSGYHIVLEDLSPEQELNQKKSQFISLVSHELRTPLTAMKSALEMMGELGLQYLSQDQQKMFEIVGRNLNRLIILIEDFIDIAAFEEERLKLHLKKEDLNQQISLLVKEYDEVCRKKGIFLNQKLDPSLPKVYFDSERIAQVLRHLIDNGLKFTESGTITVTSSVRGAKKDEVMVSVSDTGIGISEDNMPHLFEKFGQHEEILSRVHQGAGLGLVLSKYIIDRHGGKIWVESRWKKGTTIYFSLPVMSLMFKSLEKVKKVA